MHQPSSLRNYLKHRLGFALWIADLVFLFIIFFDYGIIRETPTGLSLFFWALSTLLLPIPLSFASSSLRNTSTFFAYFFPLFFLLGIIPLVVPAQMVFRFLSILSIIWIIAYTFLKRRKPETFDWKVGIHPLMFLETIVIWGLSFICSHIIVFAFKLSVISLSFSPFANYMLLMLILYIMLSIVAVILRYLNIIK